LYFRIRFQKNKSRKQIFFSTKPEYNDFDYSLLLFLPSPPFLVSNEKKTIKFHSKKQTIQNHRSKQKKAETKSNKILKQKQRKRKKEDIINNFSSSIKSALLLLP